MNIKKHIPMIKSSGLQLGGEIVGGLVGGRVISKIGVPSNGKVGIILGIASALASGMVLEYSGQCLDAAFAPEVEEVIDAE